MKVICILQARLSSKRFPKKVLKKIIGKSMIELQLERVKKSKLIDKIVVATSTSPTDDKLVKSINKFDSKINIFRGPLNNVLKRYYLAAKYYNAENIVRITADCPLIDPNIIDKIIKSHIKLKADYTSNTIIPTYPDGMDVEVFNFKALHQSHIKAKKTDELEHVTLYIKKNRKKFILYNFFLKNGVDYSNYRLTVDYPEDLILIRKIYTKLYKNKKIFLLEEIIKFLKLNPDLIKLNSHFKRDHTLKSSIVCNKVS